MTVEEIRRIAQGFGIRPRGLKKGELIRRIQKTENNIPCYGTERVDHCNETRCLWLGDCRKEREVAAGHAGGARSFLQRGRFEEPPRCRP